MIANPETDFAPSVIDTECSAVAPSPASSSSLPAHFFSIPPDEAAAANREGIPVEVLKETRTLLTIMQQIHAAKKARPECQRQATLCANRWQPETLRDKYYAFLAAAKDALENGGSSPWRVLMNKAKAPVARKNNTVLKFAFFEFWRKLGEDNQRVWSAAHTELVQIWKTGFGFPRNSKAPQRYVKIPGYMEWPAADPATGLPEGWSQANLMRYTSSPYDQVAARVGRGKAALQRLPVLTTRVGLKFMQYVEFDDHEFNQKPMFQKKPMRPLGFGAVELLSDCLCHTGYKPTLWDFEAEAKKRLTEREFMWFVVSFLCGIGYRNDATGTTLIVERGTAAIRDAFKERIANVFGGRVKVHVGGRMGKAAHDGQWNGKSHGNFMTKRLVESMWSLVDNQMAALPAQMGKDRLHAPEQLHGLEQYTQALIRQAEAKNLPDHRKQLLEFPSPPFFMWREWAMDAVKRINEKRDHNIEGWDKLGFVVPQWKMDPSIRKAVSAMDADKSQMVLDALLAANPDLATTVKLNRREVFDAHRRELTQAPLELIPELVGVENALNGGEPLEVRKGLLSFEDAEIDSDPLHFYARDGGRRGSEFLPNGDKFICFANPYDPRALVACEHNSSGKLRVIAVCPRYETPCKSDEKAVRVRMGEQNAFEGQARQRLNLRHADSAADIEAMRAHNDRVFKGTPITPAEKVAARQEAARSRAISEMDGDIADVARDQSAEECEALNCAEPTPDITDLLSGEQPGGEDQF